MMLRGDKVASREAFGQLASLPPIDDPDDEYARKYAQMYVAYLHDDLIEADKLAEKLTQIPCRRATRRILIPIEKPSALASELNRRANELTSATDRAAVEAHFAALATPYSIRVVRMPRAGGSPIKPGGSP